MYIVKKDEVFRVQSSQKGKYYEVSLKKNTCTCPNFIYRLKRKGDCKHIKAVKELHQNNAKDDFEKALEFIEEKKEVDSLEFMETFSEGILNELIEKGELIEKKGMVKKNI